MFPLRGMIFKLKMIDSWHLDIDTRGISHISKSICQLEIKKKKEKLNK